jgi:hypothetical protein
MMTVMRVTPRRVMRVFTLRAYFCADENRLRDEDEAFNDWKCTRDAELEEESRAIIDVSAPSAVLCKGLQGRTSRG